MTFAVDGAVAITGRGLLTPLGLRADCLLAAIEQGTKREGDSDSESLIVEPEDSPLKGRKGLRNLNRESRLYLLAALIARDDSKLDVSGWNGERVGVFCGTTTAGLDDYVSLYATGIEFGPQAVSPGQGPQTGLNAPAAAVAIHLDAQGPNITVSAGTTSGLTAISEARAHLGFGAIDVALTGGIDVIPRNVELPHRLGCRLAEAAVVQTLEGVDHASARGASPIAYLVGTASGFDPSDPARVVSRVVAEAIDDAGHRPIASALICAADTTLGEHERRAVCEIDPDASILALAPVLGVAPSAIGALGVVVACELAARDPDSGVLVSALDPSGAATAVVVSVLP
jgi:3-oxoacyl-[acyl-carrier-protein] synthase II